MMSEYEKQHKEKLDDLEKQQDDLNSIIQSYRTEMERHGIPNPRDTILVDSSDRQVPLLVHKFVLFYTPKYFEIKPHFISLSGSCQ